jgi:hypothetical protein
MKKLIAYLLLVIFLFGCAVSESPATPTDLEEYVEIDDDDWGSIDIKFERKVYITIDKEPGFFGDTMIMTAVLVNFDINDKVTFQWQYAARMPEWLIIDGATEQTYTLEINQTNYLYWWRVMVTVEE